MLNQSRNSGADPKTTTNDPREQLLGHNLQQKKSLTSVQAFKKNNLLFDQRNKREEGLVIQDLDTYYLESLNDSMLSIFYFLKWGSKLCLSAKYYESSLHFDKS